MQLVKPHWGDRPIFLCLPTATPALSPYPTTNSFGPLVSCASNACVPPSPWLIYYVFSSEWRGREVIP